MMCPPKAGNKAALSQSAIYPRGFGMAIAALMPERGERLESTEVDLKAYDGFDHLGSLDDLTQGRKHAWWRKAWSIR